MKIMLKERQYRKFKEVYEVDLDSVVSGCNDACIELVYQKRERSSASTQVGGCGQGKLFVVLDRPPESR
jgi:hypothetical protein